jgi:hypothetical protein
MRIKMIRALASSVGAGNSILGSGFYECGSKEKEQESERYLAWICMIRALASSVGAGNSILGSEFYECGSKEQESEVPGMNLHDPRPGLLGGGGELDLRIRIL